MTYAIDLAAWVEEDLARLPEEGRQAVMETIAAALIRPEAWPAPGSFSLARQEGPRAWVVFAAWRDGIEAYNFGWLPAHASS